MLPEQVEKLLGKSFDEMAKALGLDVSKVLVSQAIKARKFDGEIHLDGNTREGLIQLREYFSTEAYQPHPPSDIDLLLQVNSAWNVYLELSKAHENEQSFMAWVRKAAAQGLDQLLEREIARFHQTHKSLNIDEGDVLGVTAYQLALIKHHIVTAATLLNKFGASPDTVTIEGHTTQQLLDRTNGQVLTVKPTDETTNTPRQRTQVNISLMAPPKNQLCADKHEDHVLHRSHSVARLSPTKNG